MLERLKAYFETLECLTTEELDRSAQKFVCAEKKNTALVIAHIAEMSRRKGALEQGYQSTFDYCVRRLNLSEGSVPLRIQVANVSRRFPQILAALAENRISLTVAGLLAPHLTEENTEKLLADSAGMTKREVEEYIVALSPKPVFAPSIRKVPLPTVPNSAAPALPPLPESARPAPGSSLSPTILQPATPTQFNFRFSANREFKDKFERLAEVLGVENPSMHMAQILERAVDIALDKRDVKRRLERRQKRHGKPLSEATKKRPRPDEVSRKEKCAPSRYISSEVQERVHARADYQCEFRGRDGTRCQCRTDLQIEHVRPFALFHSHDEQFLRVFCPRHNRLSAERVYGVEFIERKIAASQHEATLG